MAAKQKTVAFFEVLEQIPGGVQEFGGPLDWETAITTLERVPLGKRIIDLDRRTVAGRIGIDDESHLLIHKVRSDTDWTSRANFANSTIEELIASDGEGYLDTSIVCFVPDSNKFALMRGGLSAPTHITVRDWLNQMHLFGDTRVDVRPLVEAGKAQEVQQAAAAQRVELRVSRLHRFTGPRGGLAKALEQISLDYGDEVGVTLTISMRRTRNLPDGSDDPRAILLRDVQEIASFLDEDDRASVGLLFHDGDGYTKQQVVALLEHDLSVKVTIPEGADASHITGAARLVRSQIASLSTAVERAVVRLA